MPGTLFVVATPIGNLSDLSPRAIEALKKAQESLCYTQRHEATEKQIAEIVSEAKKRVSRDATQENVQALSEALKLRVDSMSSAIVKLQHFETKLDKVTSRQHLSRRAFTLQLASEKRYSHKQLLDVVNANYDDDEATNENAYKSNKLHILRMLKKHEIAIDDETKLVYKVNK